MKQTNKALKAKIAKLEKYLKGTVKNVTSQEYYEKYEALTKVFGLSNLTPLVPLVGYKTLEEAYAKDKNLNNIPLQNWDIQDYAIRSQLGFISKEKFCPIYHKFANYRDEDKNKKIWSLSETVSLLKHVAIYHIIGATPVFEVN